MRWRTWFQVKRKPTVPQKNVYLKQQKRFEEKIYLREYKLNRDTKSLIGKMYKLFQKLNEGTRSKKKKKKKDDMSLEK